MCSYPDNLVVFQVVEEHRASNVNVEEHEEHLPNIHHSPPSGVTGHSRDMGPTCKHVTDLVGNVL